MRAQSVRAGFRAVDTAAQLKHYNQAGTGEALRILAEEDGIKREDLFLQTKFTSLDGQDRNGPLPYDPNAPLAEQVKNSPYSARLVERTDLMHFYVPGSGQAVLPDFS